MKKIFEYGFAAFVVLLAIEALLYGAAIVEATLVVLVAGLFGLFALAMCSTKKGPARTAPIDWRNADAHEQVIPSWNLETYSRWDSAQTLELADLPFSLHAAEQRLVLHLNSETTL